MLCEGLLGEWEVGQRVVSELRLRLHELQSSLPDLEALTPSTSDTSNAFETTIAPASKQENPLPDARPHLDEQRW